MIELQQLNKTYHFNDQFFHALKNINLCVKKGQIFGILGKSGAGKSTLLRCVNLLEKPTTGNILINKTNLTTLSAQALQKQRQKIGMIFQQFNLLDSRNVFENIALPLEITRTPTHKIHKKVQDLIELVGLTHRQHYYPWQLSGGQKQRVAIARALALNPDILLSDEATSALDPESTQDILKLLTDINQRFNLTILLITHQLAVVKQICDRVGIIDHGELVEEATTIDILANPQNIITQQLVKNSTHHDMASLLPSPALLPADEGALIIKLTFIGNCNIPLITQLIKQFDLTVNIRQAQIEPIKNSMLGFTICELTGKRTILSQALQYIQSTSVKAEVLHYD